LTATTVRLGVILPAADRSRRIVRETLTRYVEEVNGAGGIYGRRVELRFTEFVGVKELRDFIEREQIFAFTGSSLTGAEAVLRDTGTPAVAAFGGGAGNPYVFYLDKGAGEAITDRDVWTRATATAEIVTEALRRAGRSLTREGLIHEMEGDRRIGR
jgi:hypothetical protein